MWQMRGREMTKLLLTLEEASQATGISVEALRAAITQDYTGAKTKHFKRLPRLAAKAPTNRRLYTVLATDLQSWLEQLPDA